MKIAVAMSGGVDSSAAAAVLKEEGHELVGFTMQLWNQRRGSSGDEDGDPLPSRCCSLDDVFDARSAARAWDAPGGARPPPARSRREAGTAPPAPSRRTDWSASAAPAPARAEPARGAAWSVPSEERRAKRPARNAPCACA